MEVQDMPRTVLPRAHMLGILCPDVYAMCTAPLWELRCECSSFFVQCAPAPSTPRRAPLTREETSSS